ncbi:armadillo-type protein [Copromyces sp. CBS 386.78]|nr:armadillo-type protein [Copromyces sp. CBS 386.78]
MDFLKSAVASAIAKGPPFPYTFGDKVDLDPSIWTLYNGTRREDGSNCSIFSFDISANRSALPLAKNALKKLRTLRHPGVIKVLDTVETDSYIYIATERLVPLSWHVKRKSLSPETAKWGLYSVAKTTRFINSDASSIHGNLKVASIYTSESGEWKLGGFEVLSNVKDDDAVIYRYGSVVPDSGRYTPPELANGGWDAIKKSPHHAVDSYDFGILIYEVFNGSFLGSDQLAQTKSIPPSMQASYKRLINANPKARLSAAHFLEQGLRTGSFFDSPLIKLTEGVDNLGVKSETERDAFLEDLDQLSDDFPEDFFKMKVLPELLKSVEFGGGGPKAFGVVMKIATKLSNEDFDTKVTPVVVRLFGNPDRAIRVCLLDNLPLMIDRLPQKVVNDKIFPQIVTGFTDLAPVVREQTLKSVLVIITKLSDRTINGDLLRYLAKTANDEQPGIRTNTTICLGKIAKYIGTSSRAKVLIAVFTRSLRDPFVHARNASLMALAVTVEYFSEEDCAARLIPAVSPLLIDKEKLIRDQANKTIDVYLQRIRKAQHDMPETVIPPETAQPRMSTPQPAEVAAASNSGSGSGAVAAAWAGWAISSFTNKLSSAAGEMQPNGAPSPVPTASGLSAPTSTTTPKRPTSSSASALHRQALKSPPPPTTPSMGDSFFADPEPQEDDTDAWGDMGDMDDSPAGAGDDNWGASSETLSRPSTSAKRSVSSSSKPAANSTPFGGEDDEPDFAGWLAAQAEKKKPLAGGSKALPKGLAKTGSGAGTTGTAKVGPSTTGVKKTLPISKKPTPAPVKKIDTKPKADVDDDDGWGDGW